MKAIYQDSSKLFYLVNNDNIKSKQNLYSSVHYDIPMILRNLKLNNYSAVNFYLIFE